MGCRRTWIGRLLSIPLMLLFVLVLYVLKIPNPMIVLIIPVVYFSYRGGYISGVISGIIAVLYSCYFYLIKTDDPAGVTKVITSVLAVSTIILLVGKLKAQEQKNMVELKRREDALLHIATTDKLTGASNRHAFYERASVIYESSRRLHEPIALLFIDIDHFKQINDRYGHGFGDTVLIRLSQTLESCLRNNDINCRYGGEEFVLLLVNADGDVAQQVAQCIMEQIQGIRFEEHPDFHFTVSIGVTSMIPEDTPSIDSLVHSADNAMYRAKQAGRNQIAVECPKS